MSLKVFGKLILEDGSVFVGESFGFENPVSGEVVFNTGMVGYPETLTDPSYKGQILCLTYPLIGNYGVPAKKLDEFGILENFESNQIHVSGLIVSEYSVAHNHWNSVKSLSDWLKEEKIPALTGIDVRALTKKLREKGTMLGKIVFQGKDIKIFDPNKTNLVAEVSISKPVFYENNSRKTIALIDTGVKNNIIRSLLSRKVNVLRIPWNYDLFNSKHCNDFNAIMLSNGPGNPKQCIETIQSIQTALEYKTPIFGVCLGNQLLALASGANTFKLKYGHRSQNQPALEFNSKKCFITSQNHGFAVDKKTLKKNWSEWFVNANDETNEGIKHAKLPFMSVQFHPEACPGPVDTNFLFDEFLKKVK